MIARDANGVEIKVGDRVRLKGTVESLSDGRSIRIKPDRQPEGVEICPFIRPRVLEVVDE